MTPYLPFIAGVVFIVFLLYLCRVVSRNNTKMELALKSIGVLSPSSLTPATAVKKLTGAERAKMLCALRDDIKERRKPFSKDINISVELNGTSVCVLQAVNTSETVGPGVLSIGFIEDSGAYLELYKRHGDKECTLRSGLTHLPKIIPQAIAKFDEILSATMEKSATTITLDVTGYESKSENSITPKPVFDPFNL